MDLEQAFRQLPIGPLFDSLLIDFILAFTFFTALTYAVFGRRFPRPRPAIAMSAAVGLSLAIGLVWWLHQRGLSARDLGPVAVGFFVIVLAMVLFQALRQIGGTWSGAALALGGSLFVAALLDATFLIDGGTVQAFAVLILIVGLVLFFMHPRKQAEVWPPEEQGTPSKFHRPDTSFRGWGRGVDLSGVLPRREEVRRDLSDVHADRLVGQRLQDGLHHTRTQTDDLLTHPERTATMLAQVRALLPAEGWLTERLARLRAHAHHVREGHLADLEQTKALCRKLPKEVRRVLGAQMTAAYGKIVGIETRIDRLDAAVADLERRVRQLTAAAEASMRQQQPEQAEHLLSEAEKTQRHATRLLKRIEHTEQKLMHVVDRIAKKMKEASRV